MPHVDLADLKRRIDQAKAREKKELDEKGRVLILPTEEWLTEEDWLALWDVVRAVRRDHVDVAIQFPEEALASLIVDVLARLDTAPTLPELVTDLRDLAAAEGPWLVSTPLANITMTVPVIEVAPDAVLWRATLGREWLKDRWARGDRSAFEVHEMLGDRIAQPVEWSEVDGIPLDTSRRATLLTVENGVPQLALARARSRAQYAIAVWTILSPPTDHELPPDVGVWVPQPRIEWGQRYKRKEDGAWIPKERVRGGGVFHWAPYTAPDAETLAAPFEAFAHLERRCAQALLSAALNLFNARRRSRTELSTQLRNTMAGVEVLCEEEGALWQAQGRWEKVAARFDVWSELETRGYEANELSKLQERLRWARNIATHGADAALLDLGYPAQVSRQVAKNKFAPGTDFAVSALAADLAPLRFALGYVLRKVYEVTRRSGWDDKVFEGQFS